MPPEGDALKVVLKMVERVDDNIDRFTDKLNDLDKELTSDISSLRTEIALLKHDAGTRARSAGMMSGGIVSLVVGVLTAIVVGTFGG